MGTTTSGNAALRTGQGQLQLGPSGLPLPLDSVACCDCFREGSGWES